MSYGTYSSPVYFPKPQDKTYNYNKTFYDQANIQRNHYLNLIRTINVRDDVYPSMNVKYNYEGVNYHPLQTYTEGCMPGVPQFNLAYNCPPPSYGGYDQPAYGGGYGQQPSYGQGCPAMGGGYGGGGNDAISKLLQLLLPLLTSIAGQQGGYGQQSPY